MELETTNIALLEERTKNIEAMAKAVKINEDLRKAAIAIAARNCVLKERLNIEMPNPFE